MVGDRWRDRVRGVFGITVAAIVGTVGGASPATAEPLRFDGHAIITVDVADRDRYAALVAAGAEPLAHQGGTGATEFRVSPQARAIFDASGLRYEVVVADIQPALDQERRRLSDATPVAHGADFFADFRDLATIDTYLDDLVASHPDLLEPIEYGESLEARPLRGFSIGHPETDAATLLLTGTMHPDEWLATTTILCIADNLVRDYGRDPRITEALDRVQVVVLPMLNPDGYVHTWESNRYWRGNLRPPSGVNLNRNFPTGWAAAGPGTHGVSALSEPETFYLAQWLVERPDVVAHVDYHANGQDILYPWAHLEEPTADARLFEQLAVAQSEAIEMVHGVVYEPAQTWELAPGAGGIVLDWTYDELGILSFTPEVRPSNEVTPGHVVRPDLIMPTCEENLAGTLALLDWVVQQTPEPGSSGDTTGGSDSETGADESAGDEAAASTSGVEPMTSTDSESGRAQDDQTSDGGCSCRADQAPSSGGWLVLLAMGIAARRWRIRNP